MVLKWNNEQNSALNIRSGVRRTPRIPPSQVSDCYYNYYYTLFILGKYKYKMIQVEIKNDV